MKSHCYASTAYTPASIPDQPASTERSWLRKLGASRLPWGRTQDVAPDRFLRDDSPANMPSRCAPSSASAIRVVEPVILFQPMTT